ncbi:MAG: hypothetical protein HYW04_02190, partial [Deltaproteobacteria bacterium]|nr:hypothetical protein [Deltaproteobacteria bacterium]
VELTWGLILSLMRRIPEVDRRMRQEAWPPVPGHLIEGKTIGVVGLGRIGREVARIARAFRARVLATGRTLTEERAREAGAEAVSLETLLRESDIVTIHVRGAAKGPSWRGRPGRVRRRASPDGPSAAPFGQRGAALAQGLRHRGESPRALSERHGEYSQFLRRQAGPTSQSRSADPDQEDSLNRSNGSIRSNRQKEGRRLKRFELFVFDPEAQTRWERLERVYPIDTFLGMG